MPHHGNTGMFVIGNSGPMPNSSGRQQMVLIDEMSIRRGGGHADAARRLSQTHRSGTVGVQQLARRRNQRRAKVTVMIGGASCDVHVPHICTVRQGIEDYSGL